MEFQGHQMDTIVIGDGNWRMEFTICHQVEPMYHFFVYSGRKLRDGKYFQRISLEHTSRVTL